uniref:NADH dehydrogenase subunit 4 n=1 Tax=Pyura mirabilis TaxID=111863 RepID=UPI002551D627|nr:NADH dehydrogenase subunit 4 [Pyura mirabilis]UPP55925.1 NADH dehydrogenase subunit 4 [Pyura mirabilis]
MYILFYCMISWLVLNKKSVKLWVYFYGFIVGFLFLFKGFSTKIGANSSQFHPFFVDGLNYFFVLISIWVILLSMLSGLSHVMFKYYLYDFLFLVMLVILTFFFFLNNFFLFFIVFEASMIPIFLVIGIWGAQPHRIVANYYFIMYTMIGGLPLLVGVLINVRMSGDTYSIWGFNHLGMEIKSLLLMMLFLAFICKLPLYGFHLWLPKAHVEAPVGGSMVLAGLLLKMGGYGLLRLVLMFKMKLVVSLMFLVGIGLWGGLASVLICLRQVDLKSFIAYSSVSHMSLSLVGFLSGVLFGFKGGYIMFLAHGLVSPGMFFIGNTVYERVGTRVMSGLGGMLMDSKFLAFWFFLFLIMNLGMPPFANFFGELSIYFAVLNLSFFCFPFMFLTMVMTGVVMLKFFGKIFRSQGLVLVNGMLTSRESFVMLMSLWFVLMMSFCLFFF